MVILGLSSIGLNEMVSLLLKEDPALSCVAVIRVVLALLAVEFVWLASLAEGDPSCSFPQPFAGQLSVELVT